MTQTREEIEKFLEVAQKDYDDDAGVYYINIHLRDALFTIRQLLKEKEEHKDQLRKTGYLYNASIDALIDTLGEVERLKSRLKETEPKATIKECLTVQKEGELLTCPFCGRTVEPRERIFTGYPRYQIKCCVVNIHRSTREDAVKAWNTRTSIPQQEWRDISDAPRDRTEILAFIKLSPDHGRIDKIRFINNEWADGGGHLWAGSPTHWMPLPSPPQPPKGE
jgi:hypothetical protein